jgi:hypothetical protein
MSGIRLGINTCFATKRYSEPEEWAKIIGEKLGVREAQFSADLLDPFVPDEVKSEIIARVSQATKENGVTIHSVFTGVGVQPGNLLLHWNEGMRAHAFNWHRGLVDIAAGLGAGEDAAESLARTPSPSWHRRRKLCASAPSSSRNGKNWLLMPPRGD